MMRKIQAVKALTSSMMMKRKRMPVAAMTCNTRKARESRRSHLIQDFVLGPSGVNCFRGSGTTCALWRDGQHGST